MTATRNNELVKALIEADEPGAILAALAAMVWRRAHPGEACPADKKPTSDTLAAWQARDRPLEAEQDAVLCALACTEIAGEWVGSTVRTSDREARVFSSVMVQLTGRSHAPLTDSIALGESVDGPHPRFRIPDVHEFWRLACKVAKATGQELPRHPLAPFVRAWQERKPKVKRSWSQRSDGIVPVGLGMVNPNHKRAGNLFMPAGHLDPAGRQMFLPGFGPGEDFGESAVLLPLILYRLGRDRKRGEAAPVALRLWVEAVRAVEVKDYRLQQPVTLSITFRDLMKELWPNTHVRPGEYLPKLERAVEKLHDPEARVPWEDPVSGKGAARLVVQVTDIPRGEDKLDDLLTLTVSVLPGVAEGPALPEALAAWGANSLDAYVGLINLHLRWFVPGVTRVPAPGGKKHWLQVRDPARYPELSDDDLLDIFMPIRNERPKRRDNALKQVRKTITQLEKAGGLRSIGKVGKRGFKLLPCPNTKLQPPPKRSSPKRKRTTPVEGEATPVEGEATPVEGSSV